MAVIYKNKLRLQDTIDSTWDEMGAGVGYSISRPEGREQMQPHENTAPSQENQYSSIITDFFGFDPTGTTATLIPGYSETEPILRTPTPSEQDINLEEDEQQYGRGHRQHVSQDRLSPSGPRPRTRRPRRRG